MGFSNEGQVWTVSEFETYVKTVSKPAWVDSICLHHTGVPSLSQRPSGLTAQHLKNIRHYYETEKGWSSAPHLFIDDDQIWGMCPLTEKGVHAKSFNSRAIGIEILGNYNEESPNTGRGEKCWSIAFGAVKALVKWAGLKPDATNILFHRDDPKTTKTCPGSKVEKSWVLENLQDGSYLDSTNWHGPSGGGPGRFANFA